MNKLQKKVLMKLLQELNWSDLESDMPELTADERLELTQQLWDHWGESEEWDGTPKKDFRFSSLADLAETWIKEA
jgi:hypothetical protein